MRPKAPKTLTVAIIILLSSAHTTAPSFADNNYDNMSQLQLLQEADRAQAEMALIADRYTAARDAAKSWKIQAEALDAELIELKKSLAKMKAIFGDYARQAYMDGMDPNLAFASAVILDRKQASDVSLFTFLFEKRQQELQKAIDFIKQTERKAQDARHAAEAAEVLFKKAAVDLKIAIKKTKALEALLNRAYPERAVLQAEAVADWYAYIANLNEAKVSPPPVEKLANPVKIPQGLIPWPTLKPIPGFGQVSKGPKAGLVVLPQEVMTVVQYAISNLGKPYVWGEEGPDAFDCSGLILSAYKAAGIQLPRVAADQFVFTRSKRVSPGREMPGDLVFFETYGTRERPGHVGIVLDPGRRLMIAAPRTGDLVRISTYDASGEPLGFARVVIQPRLY